MKLRIVLLTLILCTPALAAPPPGHPTPEQARDLLMPDRPAAAVDLPNEGKVISAIDANQFTYIEVEHDGQRNWIAAPLMPIQPGSILRYEEGSLMTNFYSKLLQRTFASVLFVGQIVVTAEPKQ